MCRITEHDIKMEALISELTNFVQTEVDGASRHHVLTLIAVRHRLYGRKYEALARSYNIPFAPSKSGIYPSFDNRCSSVYPSIAVAPDTFVPLRFGTHEKIPQMIASTSKPRIVPPECPICYERTDENKGTFCGICVQYTCADCAVKTARECPYCRNCVETPAFTTDEKITASRLIIDIAKKTEISY